MTLPTSRPPLALLQAMISDGLDLVLQLVARPIERFRPPRRDASLLATSNRLNNTCFVSNWYSNSFQPVEKRYVRSSPEICTSRCRVNGAKIDGRQK